MRRVVRRVRSGAALLYRSHRPPPRGSTALVSVVIATYNRSDVLRVALASVLDQSYPALQVIVVGDGCTDDSEAVVRGCGDPRVEWVALPRNTGSQSAPNNAGLEHARGLYVAYLGHDDVWLRHHIASAVAELESTGADLVLSGILGLGPAGSQIAMLANVGDDPWEESRWLAPSCAVHTRAAVSTAGPWRDFRTIDEPPDVDFLTRVGAGGIAFVPAVTVIKFPSAWDPGSYRTGTAAQQADVLRRSRCQRLFVERELAGYWWARRRGTVRTAEVITALDEWDGDRSRGWQVRMFREIRGLPPLEGDEGTREPAG